MHVACIDNNIKSTFIPEDDECLSEIYPYYALDVSNNELEQSTNGKINNSSIKNVTVSNYQFLQFLKGKGNLDLIPFEESIDLKNGDDKTIFKVNIKKNEIVLTPATTISMPVNLTLDILKQIQDMANKANKSKF